MRTEQQTLKWTHVVIKQRTHVIIQQKTIKRTHVLIEKHSTHVNINFVDLTLK